MMVHIVERYCNDKFDGYNLFSSKHLVDRYINEIINDYQNDDCFKLVDITTTEEKSQGKLLEYNYECYYGNINHYKYIYHIEYVK